MKKKKYVSPKLKVVLLKRKSPSLLSSSDPSTLPAYPYDLN